MNAMKRLIAFVFIATFLSLQVHPAAFADDSDIFGANIQPNVVIMIDNSGSMADNAPSNSFDVPPPSGTAAYYPVLDNCDPAGKGHSKTIQPCASVKVYKSGSSSTYTTYANDVASVPDSAPYPVRNALNTAGYWSGKINGSTVNLFTGNYLNYLLGTCASGGACSKSKMAIAKEVVNSILDSVQGVRFGVMTFYYDSSNNGLGARVVSPMGTNVTVMKAAVNNLSPTGNTPLGDALYDVGQYYKGQPTANGTQAALSSPIQLECQPNFVIFITDGMQTAGTRTMPVEATNRFTQDHTTSLTGIQNVIVHTVGFGVTVNTTAAETQAAYDTLSQSAKNGGGQFYISDDETQLQRALQDAIRRIVQATFTFATPVVPTTSTTGSTKAYLAAFRSDPSLPFWRGYLKAYQRNSNGLVPVDATGVPLSSALVWEAGQVLSTTPAANRTIYTVVGGARQAFTKTNSAITNTLLAASSNAEHDKIIDFIRGIDSYDENGNGNVTEERAWKLGDIFHSTPVLVTPPVLASSDPTYQAFKTAQANRTKVLIAGANDGMLHAFRESDGVELWAFIPPDLLDNLKILTDTGADHQFFVDSSPIATDIKVGGTWKTIVVFGMRRGGPFYYALDITDTTNPQWMWSFTDSKISETWSEPSIGKVKMSSSSESCFLYPSNSTPCKFAAFFGGGYDTASNNAHGKAFFALDLSNGSKLWEYFNDGTSDDRQYMNFSLTENSTAVDLNNDGFVDRVYIGDTGGQLWKFDVSANATTSWAGKRLFTAAPSQANPPATGEFYPAQGFYGAPVLAYDTSMHLWVFLGTGDRNHPNSTASNRFYGIKETTDMTNGAALSESTLVDVTSTNGTASGGWFFRLASSEKVLDPANVFNMDVLFSSFTPVTTVSCLGGGGTAKLYSVQMTTGYAAIDFSTGTALSSTGATATRSTTIGQGIASMPVVIVTPPQGSGSATASAITATTNQQLPNNPIPAPGFLKQVRSWRERIQ
jgi:type IV pilus assembly protein PilY1